MNRNMAISRTLDVVLIAAAVVTAVRLVGATRNPAAPYVPALRQHSVLRVSGKTWAATGRNVVLLVRTTCPACQDSLPFYRTLSDAVNRQPAVTFSVLSSEPPHIVREWLGQHAIAGADILQVDPYLLGFEVEPTILIVDGTGTVTDIMTSKLSVVDQQRVLARVAGSGTALSNVVAFRAIYDAAWPERSRAADHPVLLDVRERDAFAARHTLGAVNIPQDELASRAARELPAGRPVFLDCVPLPTTTCRSAVELLRTAGFDVTLVLHR